MLGLLTTLPPQNVFLGFDPRPLLAEARLHIFSRITATV